MMSFKRFLWSASLVFLALDVALAQNVACPSDYDHTVISAPGVKAGKKKPSLNTGMLVYSNDQYNKDSGNYQIAVMPDCTLYNLTYARQWRNQIANGVRQDIDLAYKSDFQKLFGRENGIAVTGDVLTLGLGAAGSIATHAATKTIFAALGTAFTGINLSIYKNYYGQQAFQVIGLAMENRRARLLTNLNSHLAQDDVEDYPLSQALGDLAEYMRAGTLPGGLAELQQEAAANTNKPNTALAIATASLPPAKVSVPGYSVALAAQNGVPPYSFSSGSNLNGLVLSPLGVLSGTPTATGAFNIVIKVTDANSHSATATLVLNVTP